jgi:hypothetical protein
MGVTTTGLNAIASLIAGAGVWNDFDDKTTGSGNAYLGVGDSGGSMVGFSAAQNTLIGTTNTKWKQCDSVAVTNNSIVFVATFAAGDAVFEWRENGIFNGSGSQTFGTAPYAMLTRASEDLINKTSDEVVVFTKTLVISSS